MNAERVALLVLGYRAPAVLRRLVRLLHDDSRFAIYVHVDVKANLEAYASEMGEAERVDWIAPRLNVYWYGFTMVEAELLLLARGLADAENATLCLISDDSFPLLSPDRLYDELMRDKTRINVSRLGPDHVHLPRYKQFYFFDTPLSNQHVGAIGRYLDLERIRVMRAALDRAEHLIERGKFQAQPYGGSAWWSLDRDLAVKVLRMFDNEHFRESMAFTACSDEIAFQTAVMQFLQAPPKMGTPMISDFSRMPKPYVFSQLAEVVPFVTKQRLFVRKVIPDETLLEQLPTLRADLAS